MRQPLRPAAQRDLWADERGVSSVEYVVIFVLVCGLSLATWNVFGSDLGCRLAHASANIFGALGRAPESKSLAQCDAIGRDGHGRASGGARGKGSSSRRSEADDEHSARAPKPAGAKGASKPANKATVAQAWADEIKKTMCPGDRALLAAMQKKGVKIRLYDRIYYEDPYYDGTRWTTKHFEGGGSTSANGKQINIRRSGSVKEDASTVFHEGTHSQQPSGMAWREQEYDAYSKEDAWRIAHGMPPSHPKFRKTGPGGVQTTDDAAIRAFVDKKYPGVTSTPSAGAAPDQVVGRTRSGDAILERADHTTYTRPPQAGDSFAGNEITEPKGGVPVDMATLQCP